MMTTMNNNNNNNNDKELQKQLYMALQLYCGQVLMQKYKTHFMGEITLHVAQIVNTEQLQHCITQKRVFFTYIIVNTLHKCDNSDDDDDDDDDNNNNNNRVGIALSLTVRCPTVARGNALFSSPKHADRLWGPPSLKLGGSRVPSRRSTDRVLKLYTHFHLVSRLIISGASLYFP